jgi:hypothetical protein
MSASQHGSPSPFTGFWLRCRIFPFIGESHPCLVILQFEQHPTLLADKTCHSHLILPPPKSTAALTSSRHLAVDTSSGWDPTPPPSMVSTSRLSGAHRANRVACHWRPLTAHATLPVTVTARRVPLARPAMPAKWAAHLARGWCGLWVQHGKAFSFFGFMK